jgi:hypothetical protein
MHRKKFITFAGSFFIPILHQYGIGLAGLESTGVISKFDQSDSIHEQMLFCIHYLGRGTRHIRVSHQKKLAAQFPRLPVTLKKTFNGILP